MTYGGPEWLTIYGWWVIRSLPLKILLGGAGSSEPAIPVFQSVPETASGLQGYKPLVDWNNVGKGSRLNGSVSSVQRLALEAVCRGRLLNWVVWLGRRDGTTEWFAREVAKF